MTSLPKRCVSCGDEMDEIEDNDGMCGICGIHFKRCDDCGMICCAMSEIKYRYIVFELDRYNDYCSEFFREIIELSEGFDGNYEMKKYCYECNNRIYGRIDDNEGEFVTNDESEYESETDTDTYTHNSTGDSSDTDDE